MTLASSALIKAVGSLIVTAPDRRRFISLRMLTISLLSWLVVSMVRTSPIGTTEAPRWSVRRTTLCCSCTLARRRLHSSGDPAKSIRRGMFTSSFDGPEPPVSLGRAGPAGAEMRAHPSPVRRVGEDVDVMIPRVDRPELVHRLTGTRLLACAGAAW